ncbi:hypothetical protein [Caenimonas aquaedulcis]|uniref:Uncharacterized protein n=1 Tax=Caenimonas aquaedulcis TaxID=2793270 RepID=A0A931H423_9BURK|nr:hypothetical protein [Caenimonas aquaedulcis]MBG9388181.1 hypothetical protein [Caenimonas aquaedulcis]
MHFRIRKNVVQLVRNTYDATSKKAVASVVGRMPLTDPILTDEIRGQLSPSEISETEEWIAEHHRLTALRTELAVFELATNIDLAAKWLEQNAASDVARNAAPQILQSWQKLRAILRKADLVE